VSTVCVDLRNESSIEKQLPTICEWKDADYAMN